eukprot:scaffold7378_cov410-Prasinococcus_capsulatus_cf.AAC.5
MLAQRPQHAGCPPLVPLARPSVTRGSSRQKCAWCGMPPRSSGIMQPESCVALAFVIRSYRVAIIRAKRLAYATRPCFPNGSQGDTAQYT